MSTNHVELRGGLVKDPDVRQLDSGGQTVEATLAINGTRYDSGAGGQVVKTNFFIVQAWANVADELVGYDLHKGDELYVVGELDQIKGEKDRPSTRITVFQFTVVRKRMAPPPPRPDDNGDPPF